ncbi:MAG: peptide MFS transporter [Bacteroidota bacterium]|nr:peptide MFS transporter [Bacteroidota bacterium]MDX5429117.1 peptide MFS transporter [Bacteroidota bacterium]MDX5448943.1 peptide MFS transporter [Bacteroidota bacterium]MDX5506766.1 peptide MFS transporter [Bacteroidota bacterium]
MSNSSQTVNLTDQELSKKPHPPGLYTLFFTEMWERFSYYGMRALLVLYLTSSVMENGFNMDRAAALEIYALFTGLVFLTPILGGYLADTVLGQRKAIYIGGLLMALGQFGLATSVGIDAASGSKDFFLNLGLGLLIMGNGFFKPNISTIVGALYTENDPRKDSAFTIFYMGINLGAFLSPLTCGYLGENIGWEYGFGTAGLGMLLGLTWFFFRTQTLEGAGLPPNRLENDNANLKAKDYIGVLLYTGVIIALVIGFLYGWNAITENTQNILIWILAIAGTVGLGRTIIKGTSGKDQWSRVTVILILSVFNIFFWSGFEQAGGTFNLFAAEQTDRMMFGFEIPASWFQSINAIAIFGFAPLFSMLWVILERKKLNPRTPVKFGLGLTLLGLGFVIMYFASLAAENHLVSPFWLVSVYLIHTFGELCLSPVGLSMVTKLAPQKIVSVMMGVWFAFMALANYLAGMMENLLHNALPDMNLFLFLTITSGFGAVLLFLLSPMLGRMMKGIH